QGRSRREAELSSEEFPTRIKENHLRTSPVTASGIHTLVSVRKQKNNARRCMWLVKPL
ncbi:unnamed protein product, partial [Porites lobata]